MTLSEKQAKFASLLVKLITFINSQPGYRCTIGEVERPQALQDLYVQTGKSKTKKSAHLYNLAADIRIFEYGGGQWNYLAQTEDYKFAGEHWESLDPECVWGGRFGDNPKTEKVEGWDGNHFQYTKV